MARTQTLRFDNPKIERLYEDVPVEQVARLHQFRADYPYRRTTINGIQWEYLDTGRGDRVLLVLPGALGTSESGWQTIAHFAGREGGARYRVISPCYPPAITTMAALVDGIAELLDRVGVSKTHVMGGSAGGFVAQVFVRRHPGRTDKLIVAHAGTPNPERGAKIAGALWWLRLLPMGLLRLIVRKRLGGLLPQGAAEMAFVRAYLLEAVSFQLTKESFISVCRRGADFDLDYTFVPQDLTNWPGEVLLIMADDDPSTPEPVRQAMTTLYPQAQVHMFHGTGHAAAILKQAEYLAVIETFIG